MDGTFSIEDTKCINFLTSPNGKDHSEKNQTNQKEIRRKKGLAFQYKVYRYKIVHLCGIIHLKFCSEATQNV